MGTIRPGYNDLLTWCNNNGARGKLLIEEWNQEKNYNEYGMPVVMQEVSCRTSRNKYWWKCKTCGNDFQMSAASRTLQEQGCPICGHKRGGIKNHLNALQNGNDLYSWCKENGIFGKKIMDEWDTRKNMDLFGIGIADISCGSSKKVHWICSRCGKKYESSVSHRTICRTGCNQCNRMGTSFPEQVIYMALKQIYPDAINRGKAFGIIEYDICIPSEKFCIEYNGEYWHKHKVENDMKKRELCNEYNVRLIQIIANSTGIEWEASNEKIVYKISCSKHLLQIHKIIEYIVNMLGNNISKINYNEAVDAAYRVMFREVENNIKELFPELIEEWDYENNGSMKPEYFTPGAHYCVNWKCKNCGKRWNVGIKSRIKFKTGCSKCGFNIFDGKIHDHARNRKEGITLINFV